MIRMSLDMSIKATGWSIIDHSTNSKHIVAYGIIPGKDVGFTRSARILSIMTEVEALLLQYQPDEVVLEDVYQGPNPQTNKLLAQLMGAALYLLESSNIPHNIYPAHTWRKLVANQYGYKLVYKTRKECKAASIAFIFAQYCLVVSDDESDAIAMALV